MNPKWSNNMLHATAGAVAFDSFAVKFISDFVAQSDCCSPPRVSKSLCEKDMQQYEKISY
jgi:hypothetical protein